MKQRRMQESRIVKSLHRMRTSSSRAMAHAPPRRLGSSSGNSSSSMSISAPLPVPLAAAITATNPTARARVGTASPTVANSALNRAHHRRTQPRRSISRLVTMSAHLSRVPRRRARDAPIPTRALAPEVALVRSPGRAPALRSKIARNTPFAPAPAAAAAVRTRNPPAPALRRRLTTLRGHLPSSSSSTTAAAVRSILAAAMSRRRMRIRSILARRPCALTPQDRPSLLLVTRCCCRRLPLPLRPVRADRTRRMIPSIDSMTKRSSSSRGSEC
jgi:hypothetical protein